MERNYKERRDIITKDLILIVALLTLVMSHAVAEPVLVRPISNGREFGGPVREAIAETLAKSGRIRLTTDRAAADYTVFVSARSKRSDGSPMEMMVFDGEGYASIEESLVIGEGFPEIAVLIDIRHSSCRDGRNDERITFSVYRRRLDAKAMAKIGDGVGKRLNRVSKMLSTSRMACR